MELLKLLCECDGVHRREFAVDLEDDVDVFSCTFTHGGDIVDGVGDESFERHALEAVGQRVGLDRGPTFFSRFFRRHVQALSFFTPVVREREFCRLPRSHQEVEADFVAGVSAEEVPDRRVETLALDVPKSDVDCADCTGKSGAAERAHAVHVLPVMFDAGRIFADEVIATLFGDSVGSFHVCPARRLSDTVGSIFRPDSDDVVSARRAVGTSDEHRFDFCDCGFGCHQIWFQELFRIGCGDVSTMSEL